MTVIGNRYCLVIERGLKSDRLEIISLVWRNLSSIGSLEYSSVHLILLIEAIWSAHQFYDEGKTVE